MGFAEADRPLACSRHVCVEFQCPPLYQPGQINMCRLTPRTVLKKAQSWQDYRGQQILRGVLPTSQAGLNTPLPDFGQVSRHVSALVFPTVSWTHCHGHIGLL